MKVRRIMSKGVIAVRPGDGIERVLEIFSSKRISGVPVAEKGKLVGIITDGDVISRLDIRTPRVRLASSPDFILAMAGLKGGMDRIIKEMRILKEFQVSDFMTRRVHTVGPDDPVTDVAALMHQKKIDRVPVVDRKGKLVGIVARQDIIKAMASC